MGNHRNRFPARRRFLKQSAALSAGAVAVGTPLLALGQANAAEPKASQNNVEASQNGAPADHHNAAGFDGAQAKTSQTAPVARPARRRNAG